MKMTDTHSNSGEGTPSAAPISKQPRFSGFMTPLLYTAVIVAVLALSGRSTELLNLEGITVYCDRCEPLAEFYHEVLGFSPVRKTSTIANRPAQRDEPIASFLLPDKRYLWLVPRVVAGEGIELSRRHAVVFRVRNGIKRIQTRVAKSASKNEAQGARSKNVDPLSNKPWGNEFSVLDPEGNLFVFFEPAERASRRFEEHP